MPKAALVHNPVSGAGRGPRLVERVEEQLRAAGMEVLASRPTEPGSGATGIAAELGRQVDLLVVVGGDGSLREAVEGLGEASSRVTLGFVPQGNANVVARELGIPREMDAALRLLGEGTPRALDVGTLDDVPFLAMVGIGWDALCVRLLDRTRHTRAGRALYRLWADALYGVLGAAALLRPFPPAFAVRVDGEPLPERCYGLVASNCRTYGKGWQMTPDADPADGQLDFQAVRRWLPPFLVAHVVAAARRRPPPAAVARTGRGLRITIESERPLPVQVDGDWLGYRRTLDIGLRPGAVRILAPP